MAGHHDHSPGAGGQAAGNRSRLAWTLGLVVLYAVAEVVGGLVTGSLALLADAGHMVSDAGALALALFALWMSHRPAGAQHTYGYRRIEVLAALVNGASLLAISVLIAVEAVERLNDPPDVAAPGMMLVAAGGLVVNFIALALLHRGSSGPDANLNLRGAWLHVLTDTLGSLQALIAGGLIWAFGWNLADPIASLLISALVVYSSWSLLRETVRVLMEQAPKHISVDEVRATLEGLPGVVAVHDLHVWTITSGMEALSAHLVAIPGTAHAALLTTVREALHDGFHIEHVTVQIEPEAYQGCDPCGEPAAASTPGAARTGSAKTGSANTHGSVP